MYQLFGSSNDQPFTSGAYSRLNSSVSEIPNDYISNFESNKKKIDIFFGVDNPES